MQPIPSVLSHLLHNQTEHNISSTKLQLYMQLKITLGGLFIRGYRIFRYALEEQCVVLVKREQFRSKWVYVGVVREGEARVGLRGLATCVAQTNRMFRKKQHVYSLLLVFMDEAVVVELEANPALASLMQNSFPLSRQQLLAKIPCQFYRQQQLKPQPSSLAETTLTNNHEQQRRLREIVCSYIDTFGQKYKISFYKQLHAKAHLAINTINLLVFQLTRADPQKGSYNQIQSSTWTAFKNNTLEQDRKDIVLTGNGRVLVIDIVFLRAFAIHIDDAYRSESAELRLQCENTYAEGKIKVVRITNGTIGDMAYGYETRLVDSFPKN